MVLQHVAARAALRRGALALQVDQHAAEAACELGRLSRKVILLGAPGGEPACRPCKIGAGWRA